jgi:hypothetical protein
MTAVQETVKQCKSCPWRVDCDPDNDIPNGYCRKLHGNLIDTIAKDASIPLGSFLRVMACHYSKPDEAFACAGWLHNQLGVGNNIGVRLAVMGGRFPVPEIDGEQHEAFEDTIPTGPKRRTKRRKKTR